MSFSFAMATLGAIAGVAVMLPSVADEDRFMQYLDDHGYNARYATGRPVPRTSTIGYGLYACSNLRAHGDPGESTVLPQFALIAEAAQHTLCPDTLADVPG